ncbi:ABC transporter ATP-binding protein [Candidatus Uabimicrobium amorphum]|uniref:ABC transporter ATP-binding protein n=1 Tax=Uabimicrobium amorphum TaxID=2596890 RepID=A0A5S9IIH2_UABAM|nr:ATP-binding cassette domain-containing protein [Candidatus Uabimicrobium amorphum]BBM82001.1 ABC transporter ATP-binding protein [Candidatus Uabimicrobium amorphum]
MKIEFKDVALQYAKKEPLFREVNFSVCHEDYVIIRGSSGTGKSSLLRLMNRLLEPSSGEIFVDDKPLYTYEVTHLRRKVTYLQQTPIIVEGCVAENLLLPFHLVSATKPAPSKEELRKWLDDLLLKDVCLDDDAQKLSVGQKQRIAFIRCLLLEPSLLLCDEPTSSLDPTAKDILEQCLENYHLEKNIGIVLVTHTDVKVQKAQVKKYILDSCRLREL